MKSKIRKDTWLILCVLFIASTIVRGVIAARFGEYTVFGDEFLHVKLAQSIAAGNGLMIRGALLNYTECLYSIVISPVFLLTNNTQTAHSMIMWLNAALMSSAIFPIFLIARKFLKDSRHVWLSVAYGLLIAEMSYTLQVMQENLNYPLMMWFFLAFSHVILEQRNRMLYVSRLGVFAFVISRCKQMNLAVVLAVVMYFAIQFMLDKKIRRQAVRDAIIYIGTYLVLKVAFDLVVSLLLTNEVGGVHLTDSVLKVFNFKTIRQLIYPAITYTVFTILATGIFPLPMLIGNWKILESKTKKMLILALSYIFIAIVAICILIVPAENLGDLVIRFHSRYYFYSFILIIILFLQFYEEYQLGNLSASEPVFLLGCGIGLLSVLPVTLAWGFVDGVSTLFLFPMSGNDAMKNAAKCILICIIVLGTYFYNKRKLKKMLNLTIAILTVATAVGSYFYVLEQNNNTPNEAYAHDALRLNEYFSASAIDRNTGENILIVANRVEAATFSFECYLNEPYRFLDSERIGFLNVGQVINFNDLLLTSYNANWFTYYATPPEFIISMLELPLQGYDEIDLGLETCNFFQWNGEEVKLLYRESNIYSDRWLGGTAAAIQLAGSLGSTDAVLSLSVDNGLVGEELAVNYSDESGYSSNFIIPNTGEKVVLEIPIHKPAEATSYIVTITPTQAGQPDNGDSRNLSFRLWDYQVTESVQSSFDQTQILDEAA